MYWKELNINENDDTISVDQDDTYEADMGLIKISISGHCLKLFISTY